MDNLQTLRLAHLPSDLAVHIALFQNVQNAAFLRQQLLEGNKDFEYALLDASVV
jgi:EKC/KEOPS complex subunit CGI121/TPRKB